MTRPVRIQLSTPLPVPVAGLEPLMKVIENLADRAGVPLERIFMEQFETDLVLYFNLTTQDPT